MTSPEFKPAGILSPDGGYGVRNLGCPCGWYEVRNLGCAYVTTQQNRATEVAHSKRQGNLGCAFVSTQQNRATETAGVFPRNNAAKAAVAG